MSSHFFHLSPKNLRDIVILSIAILAHSVFAQTSITKVASETQNNLGLQLNFELAAINYLSDSIYDNSQQQKALIELNLKNKGLYFYNINFLAGTFSLEKSFYFAAPEIYAGYGNLKENYFVIGRINENYNFIDRYYNLGLFNSYFTNDFIEYKEQGITGFHFQFSTAELSLRLALSPYFFPNQGPQVHEDNGSLVSSNRWAQKPPPQFQFADKNHEIIYAIREYKLNEIIENHSEVVTLMIGQNPEKPNIQLSYGNKPLNEIPLTRDTYGSAKDFVGHVDLSPVVTYHEVKSVDFNFAYKNLKSNLSYIEDQVKNKKAAENETLQYLAPLKIYGFYTSLNLESLFMRKLNLSLQVAELTGGEIKDLDQNGKESVFAFSSQRTQFKSPTTLGISSELFSVNSQPLYSQVRWTYDRSYKGSLLATQFDYMTASKINLHLGFDLIGVENSLPVDAPSNFLDQNLANDRFYGGMQYVF